MGSPGTGKCVLEGREEAEKTAARPPPSPNLGRRHPVVGLGGAGQGRGLGKFLSPPPCGLQWSLGTALERRGQLEALQVSLVGPGDLAPEVCGSTRTLARGMLFRVLRLGLLLLERFAWGEQSVIHVLV